MLSAVQIRVCKSIVSCLLLILSISIFTGCSKSNDDVISDPLESSNILGTWEIQNRTVNGTTNPEALCCEFITFMPDQNKGDLYGLFESTGNGSQNEGSFTFNDREQTFTFIMEDKELIYRYDLTLGDPHDIITYYFLEGTDEISEDWIKVD